MSKEDEQLFEAIQTGREQAFEKLFRKYYNKLYNFARRYVVRDALAKDIVQDVFLKFWLLRKNLAHGKGLQSYLFKAVRNEALNHVKHLSVKQRAFEELAFLQEERSAFSVVINNDYEVEQLQKALDTSFKKLPPRCREIFLLSRDDGLTYREIAKVLNISVKTVETQMGRALKKLRISLTDFLSFFLCLSLAGAGLLMMQ